MPRFFITLVAVLCIVANPMGVATAMLVLPTSQWANINVQEHVFFGKMNSPLPPSNEAIAPVCSNGLVAAGNYSCTGALYKASLDELVAAADAASKQSGLRSADLL